MNVPPDATSALSSADITVKLLASDDHWALKYINLLYIQPILEAIDDDGSGFINIKEVNTFTSTKPNNWR